VVDKFNKNIKHKTKEKL